MRGMLGSLLVAIATSFGGGATDTKRMADTNHVIRFGFRQRSQHAKRSTTAAKAKRAAKKRRNIRARAAK